MIFSNLMDRAILYGLLIGREKYVKLIFAWFLGTNISQKNEPISWEFSGKLGLKTIIGKKRPILRLFTGKIR